MSQGSFGGTRDHCAMGTFFLCVGLRACLPWPQDWTRSNWSEVGSQGAAWNCRDPWAGCFQTESLLIRTLSSRARIRVRKGCNV